MKQKLLALCGLMLLTVSSAQANDVNNNIVLSGGTSFFGALHTDNANFTDTFNFNIAGSVTANTSLITIGSGLNNIDFLSADLNGTPLTLSPTGYIETGSLGDTVFTGPLVLTVKGKSGAAGGVFASYSGTLNVVVPEPTSIAMLSAVGLLAGVAVYRRRKA